MINIMIPYDNNSERKYILEIIFGEFLGIEFNITESRECFNWEIQLSNKNILVIEDHFFINFKNNLEYLTPENIPTNIIFQHKEQNKFIYEDDIPIIFGEPKIVFDGQNSLLCGIDIFASSFFMLTRWEEYVCNRSDRYDRFCAVDSVAFKNGFLDRVIVNEYLEMLWNMLIYLGFEGNRATRKYELMLTHDVDIPLKYPKWHSGFKNILGDIIKRRDINLAFKNLLQKFSFFLGRKQDPFDNFDYFMDVAESLKCKAYFFFMPKGETKFDARYSMDDSFIKKLLEKIKLRGHYIGIHPTYNSCIKNDSFLVGKSELELKIGQKITYGRQHLLRLYVPHTWQIWEANGMKWDSTLGYHDRFGFRAGCCYEYSVFDMLNRKKLLLKERPLSFMDATAYIYNNESDYTAIREKVIKLANVVKRYSGQFVVLWHNNAFEGNTNEKFWIYNVDNLL